MKTLTRVALVAGAIATLSLSLTFTSCKKDEKKENNEAKTEAFGQFNPTSIELTGATPTFKLVYGEDAANVKSMTDFLKGMLGDEAYNAAKEKIEAGLKNLDKFNLKEALYDFKADGKFEATMSKTVKVEGTYTKKDADITVKATLPTFNAMQAIYAFALANEMNMKVNGDNVEYDVPVPMASLATLLGLLGLTPEQLAALKAKEAEFANAKLHNILTKKK